LYHTCLYCTKDLGTNEVLETLPIGRRVAFDAAHGRLWVVCRSCAKWNLVPFDTRLETIDACERLFRDTRTRYSTDNIGLARVAEGLDLIRIGAPQRPEFASWRYGAQYRLRRRRTRIFGAASVVTPAIAIVALESSFRGAALLLGGAAAVLPQLAGMGFEYYASRKRRLQVRAPDGKSVVLGDMLRSSAGMSWKDGRLSVRVATGWRSIGWRWGRASGWRLRDPVEWAGDDARLLGRRILAHMNASTGSRKDLNRAVGVMEEHRGHLESWMWYQSFGQARAKPGAWNYQGIPAWKYWQEHDKAVIPLAALCASDLLAIEMWLSEEDEAKALAGELALLERQWQEAEELAAIADSLAVSDDVHTQVGRGR
jgi:hypothetical protein